MTCLQNTLTLHVELDKMSLCLLLFFSFNLAVETLAIAIKENEEIKLRNCYRHTRDQIITMCRGYNGGPL